MKIHDNDFKLVKELVDAMAGGELTRREKIIFVTGTLAGMHSDEKKVKELLDQMAEVCLIPDAEFEEIKDFSN